MSTALKNFVMIVIKNALNAILTNVALMTMMSGAFNVRTVDGWWNIGKATLSVIGAREAAVWIPVLLKWSTTSSQPATVTPGQPPVEKP